jgi:hypothetical protein
MHKHVLKSIGRFVALGLLASMPMAMTAQSPKTAMANNPDSPPKWDIFAGFSSLIPNGDFCCLNKQQFGYNSIDYGAIFSVTRYFNRHIGVRVELDEHDLLPETNITTSQPGDDFTGGSVGVVYRIPTASGKWIPSFHVEAGGEQVGSKIQKDVIGFSLTAGGSLDYRTSAFKHHLGIRLYQADYQYLHASFAANQGGTYNFNPQGRLSAGLVWYAGSFAPPTPIAISCAASPRSVYAGDPITVTATASNLDPKLHDVYSWSGSGVTGKDTTATVNTAGLAPGTYTVNCGVKEGKAGMEGMKPWEAANSTASFTVQGYEAPTISCSANPSIILPGGTSMITSSAVSPQNRPLTYTYTVTGGSISGSGRTATFSSAGAATGTVGVTCKAADDKGHVATANTTVTIQAPPPIKVVHAYAAQCSPLNFSLDKKRPTRIDNTASACLDIVARDMKSQTGLKTVVVGESTAEERAETAKQQERAAKHKKTAVIDYAAQRAVNAKDYLVNHEGIDASLVSAATGTMDGETAQVYEVPPGANFGADFPGTTPVSDSVMAQKRVPLPMRHAGKKK